VSERGWVTVENAIEICRSPEDVFDYLTDITKEVEWNPRTRRVEKLTPGPIGLGTRFGAEWIKGNPAVVEYVRFERPMAWASVARSRRLHWLRQHPDLRVLGLDHLAQPGIGHAQRRD
jgi:hypothetical protein